MSAETRSLLYAAVDNLKEMKGRCDTLAGALRELVRLKDLKTDAEAINCSGNWEAKHKQDAMRAEYKTAQPLAWDSARRVLTAHDAGDERER